MKESRDWVESLLNLQEIDHKSDRMKEQIANAPLQKKEAQTNLDARHQAALLAKENFRKKELEIKGVNAKIDSLQQQINNLLQKSSSVKDNDTYKAILSEIDSFKKQISVKEDEVLAYMEELDEVKAIFKEKQDRLREAVNSVEQTMSDLDVRVENCQKQVATFSTKRQELASLVDEEILNKYNRIRQSRGGRSIALVEVNNGKCGHCHLQLTTQEILSASKQVPLTTCGNCGSLLYS